MRRKEKKARAKRRSQAYGNERIVATLANLHVAFDQRPGRLTHGTQWNFKYKKI